MFSIRITLPSLHREYVTKRAAQRAVIEMFKIYFFKLDGEVRTV